MSKENQEMIERALGPLLDQALSTGPLLAKILAEQAIVIEDITIEHMRGNWTKVSDNTKELWRLVEHRGTPGKALAIMISLGKE